MKMAFWQWMGMAVAAAMICMAVRIYQPQMAGLCAAAAGLMLLLWALDGLESVRQTFGRIASLGGLEEAYMQLLVKVMGVSYASEMAAQTCLDLGEEVFKRNLRCRSVRLCLLLFLALLDKLAGKALVSDGVECCAGGRCFTKTGDLNGD